MTEDAPDDGDENNPVETDSMLNEVLTISNKILQFVKKSLYGFIKYR